MYYEIVYTRCKYGFNNSWKPSKNEGFKVYKASSDLYKNSIIDNNLLMQTIQKKINFKDENKAEDIYIYNRDSNRTNILNVFHVIPVDDNPTGKYDNRSGMYVNQAIIGSFDNIYPYELFGDIDTFTMLTKSRTFFYDEEEHELDIPPKKITPSVERKYTPEAIKNFIADGRTELLKKAVLFIMSQKQQDVRRPKNLVIRDNGVENIELWIAALESAFSPRAAAGLTFAVKYDDYKMTKPYFDIIGFNSSEDPLEIKNTEQSSYVVLDGIKKEINYTLPELKSDYFNLVTTFGKEHFDFVKGFLNSFGLYDPSLDIIKIYESYRYLQRSEYKNVSECTEALKKIEPYEIIGTEGLEDVYRKFKNTLDYFIKDDLKESLAIVSWLQKASVAFNDSEMADKIDKIIISYAKDALFKNYKKGNVKELYEVLKDYSCFNNIKKWLADTQTMDNYESVMRKFAPEDYVTYYELVRDETDDEKFILSRCAKVCAGKNENDSFKNMLDVLVHRHHGNALTFLIESVNEYEADELPRIIEAYFRQGTGIRTLEKLFSDTVNSKTISKDGKLEIFRLIDKKLDVSNSNEFGLAEKLQKMASGDVKLINSSHIMVLQELDNVTKTKPLKDSIQIYENQGFPFVGNEQYIDVLTDMIISSNMNQDDYGYIVGLLCQKPEYLKSYLLKLTDGCEKYKNAWNYTLSFIGNLSDSQIKRDSAAVIANKLWEKNLKSKKMESFLKYIEDEKGREYYQIILNKLEERNGRTGRAGFVGKLFGRK